jgi:hypothetical protein
MNHPLIIPSRSFTGCKVGRDRVVPAVAETLGDDAPPAPEPKLTELHNACCA